MRAPIDVRLPTRVRPRSVLCVIEHAHRDRSVAEAVSVGRFTHAGTTLELGPEPDWLGAELPGDEEWRIEWTKFYYGLDLAHAYRETGAPRFLEAWERLVRSWIESVPVGSDSTDVTARRIQNWVYAWNAFASAPGFAGLAPGLDDRLLASVAEQAAYIRHNLTPERNHRTLELYSLLVAALALPALDPDGRLLELAQRELHLNLLADIRPDGVHRESSTHYHLIALRSFLGARENLRRFGLRFPAGYDARLERACEFALHCHRPDGAIPALSDSDTGTYADVLELAASSLGRPDFLYAATNGSSGEPPSSRCAGFPLGGYFFQRSGWGERETAYERERFLVFDCGPLGDGGHGHYDALSVEIAAGGRPLLVDPGRYTYSEHGSNLRRWFKSTAAHNSVTVDGLDQTPYRRGKPKGPVAECTFLGRMSTAGLDVLAGEVRSPAYESVHTRRITFVADEYWLIEDRLRGQRAHRYDLRFHLAPEAHGATSLTRDGESAVVRAPGLALVVLAPGCDARLEHGWFAPEYGILLAAPVVSVAAAGRMDGVFFTLVKPLEPDAPAPQLQVRWDDGGAMMMRVSGVGPDSSAFDTIAWRGGAGEPRGAVWMRESASGSCVSERRCEHTAEDTVALQ